MVDKKGEMQLSFGMIFSIILIVVFIAFAFWAIGKFLNMQKNVQIEQFSADLQSDVDKMLSSTSGSKEENYTLPKNIESVCFVDREYENLIFHSSKPVDGKKIEHIDVEKILEQEEPFCIENEDNKVSLILEKNYGESLVTISKTE